MTPEEIRVLFTSGELQLDDMEDHLLDDPDRDDDMFEEEDEFHGRY